MCAIMVPKHVIYNSRKSSNKLIMGGESLKEERSHSMLKNERAQKEIERNKRRKEEVRREGKGEQGERERERGEM